MTSDERDKVETILDYFDFDKVARVMNFLGWKWGTNTETPNVPELRELARKHLSDCIDNDYRMCTSGGLLAEWDKPTGFLSLKFVLESFDYEPETDDQGIYARVEE